MEEITINFGLLASEKFPAVARARVLTDPRECREYTVAHDVVRSLEKIGCVILITRMRRTPYEPTLVVKMLYPVSDEKADCAPPSVLKYSKYHRLYEVACWFAQDCLAVLEVDGTGVLVGANCSDWGCSFDRTKFITLGD